MGAKKIKPKFEDLSNPQTLVSHVQELKKQGSTPHTEVLDQLIEQIESLDFEALANPHNIENFKLANRHYLVLSIENILKIAESNRWSLCKNQDFIYLFNGSFWNEIDKDILQRFLGEAANKMGVPEFTAKHFQFREQLYKQFLSTAYLPTPENNKDTVLINLQNGTFEISPKGNHLRQFNRADFITYQLPFEYNCEAKAPLFEKYLNRVLPDKERQKVLAEYLGYLFIKHGSRLKLEAALVLYGTGANGKSVFYEVVNALVGPENISSYSLEELTDNSGYYRAMISNKLVNYASEINGRLQTDMFKKMVSGEVMPARLPYGKPMQLKQYAKFIFNCNELPKDVEHTNAYFRRWLIIPFDVTIPKEKQDSELHSKIIKDELSGVFNWVLEGLNRLLKQKKFTYCDASNQAIEKYKTQSDSVKMFLDENNYQKSPTSYELIKDLYTKYRGFCMEDGYNPVNKSNFIKRLTACGVDVARKNMGNVAYLSNLKGGQ
ncbi:phage/plasmid primase, P4 family [Flammeovirgaceae bacterium SG7u.111]|nr:phage/plasmid primase, P4 family [Flammeovirgaceae bacterium SG7u.132]WPO33599.1 phage/plasmid primase, P4 family [Flammeovirgaceae bacterium SG7u.111]